MARLLDRLNAPAERSKLPEPDYVAAMSLGNVWPTQGRERVNPTFPSFAIYAFGSNAVVYACTQARMRLLSQTEFKFQDLKTGRLFGSPELAILENPWPNGTTSDLVSHMELGDSIAGNAFVRRQDDTLIILRPDWVDIVSVLINDGEDINGEAKTHHEVVGYIYSDGGPGVGAPVFYDVSEVAHWTPMPDPMSRWRGMSWLTPVLREINADVAMTQHRQLFFDQGTTLGTVLKYNSKLKPEQLESIRDRFRARYAGPQGAGATLVLDEGGDIKSLAATFESMRFTDLQSAGEARIASAAGVPPIIAGLQAGLNAQEFNAYAQSMKGFANATCVPLWQSLVSALAKLINVPPGARLWYSTNNIPALREDEKDRATAMQVQAAAASTLLMSGFTADSIVSALLSGDLSMLEHTGLVSVQLYKAAAKEDAALPITKVPVDTQPVIQAPKLYGA